MFRTEPFLTGAEQLQSELKLLDLILQQRVLQLRAANLLTEDEFRGLYVSDAQIDAVLKDKNAPTADQQRTDGRQDARRLAARIAEMRKENEARAEAGARSGITLPLPELVSRFGLTAFDVSALMIAVAPEIDLRYESLYAYVQNDVTRKRPTVQLVLDLLCPTPEDHFAARTTFSPSGPLLRQRLLRLYDDPQDREPPFPARFLKAEERIVDFLLETGNMDARLLPFTEQDASQSKLDTLDLNDNLLAQLKTLPRSLKSHGGLILFQGPYGVGKRAAAAAICTELGLGLVVSDMCQVAANGTSFATIMPLLIREAVLQKAGLYLNRFEALLSDDLQARGTQTILSQELAGRQVPVFLGSESLWRPAGSWPELCFLSFEFPLPDFPLRLRHWQQALTKNDNRSAADVNATVLANKFILSGGAIADAVQHAHHVAALREGEQAQISMADIEAAARAQSNQGLRRLAQKVETPYQWTDIVLPPKAMQQLKGIYAASKYRHVVYSDWGFDEKLYLGKGLNALFCGSSGTGKTMAASILAHELGLDLYKIDLASVVSKYIGETEKHLNRIFDEARTSNAILFFDEADALFGKRSEVKDAHDRYANIEVAYLLQKMEEYDGMVVLATNMRNNLDEAFTRRMHHIVEFPFPDANNRERIWRGMIPRDAPIDERVDFRFLARQFDLAGGNIRNVTVAAAFLAAEQSSAPPNGKPKNCITMEHLIIATSRELQKMGKLPSRAGFREYYDVIRDRETSPILQPDLPV